MSILLACDFDAADWAAWLPALQAALPGERLLLPQDLAAQPALREDIDVAIVANPPPGLLAGLPRLGLIQSLWAGVDRLLADPTLPAEVALARMVDPAMNTAMAETALWAVLTLHRHFHLYARQQRWSEAQQAYFQAYAGEPDNPDIIFNLAVSLDHLRQGKLAAQYYQMALDAGNNRATAFNRDQVNARLRELRQP